MKGLTNWVRFFSGAALLVEELTCELLVRVLLDVPLGVGPVEETLLCKTALGPVLR